MNLSRIFANAVARRVAFVLVAVVLAWLGIGRAHAQYNNYCAPNQGNNCDQALAYSVCVANVNWYASQFPNSIFTNKRCEQSGSNYNGYFTRDGSPGSFNQTYFTSSCSARLSEITLFYPPSGSVACNNGCAYKYRETGDGETTVRSPTGKACLETPECANLGGNYIWNGYLNVCQPVAPECEAGYKAHGTECVKEDSCPDGMSLQNGVCKQDEDTCPPGNIRSPVGSCLPGDGQCASGEARRPNGTCGKDSDNDGVADDDDDDPENDTEKSKASGGDSCDAPPSCSGDAIACMQVKIQWRIDCNTRSKANISGGHCGAGGMPVCSGDGCNASEHAQLIQQWKSACALEKIAANNKGTTPGTGETTAEYLSRQRAADIADANAIADGGDGHGGVSEEGIFHTFTSDDFNPNMFGGSGGGSCSFSTQLELLGRPITLPPGFWTLASMIGWLIVAAAYIWVAMQLGGK